MQYYVLSVEPQFSNILTWLDAHGCWYEVHLNRTRFHVEQGRLLTEFMLKYSMCIGLVDQEELV